MKNIKCIIRRNLKTKDHQHLVYLRYTYNRRYILFRTEVYVSITNWNRKSGRVKKSFNYELKNSILSQKERDLETNVLELISNKKEPTLLNVKIEFYKARNHYQNEEAKPNKQDEKRFLKDFKNFINDKKDNEKVSPETIKTYNTTYNKLEKFQKESRYFLHYDTINNDFYFKFLKYLRAEGLYDNSVDKHIKNLKLFMYYTLSKEKHTNNLFQTFKRTRTKADFVVLEFDELRKLYYDYKPKNEKHRAIRDTFVLGCSTGLRFGDLTKLSRGNFIITRDKITNEIIEEASYSYIKVPVQKTTDFIRIPFNHFICEMINYYEIENKEITFLKYCNQVFNREIKVVCREAGITNSIKVSKKKNSKLIPTEKAKCDFISSHTMRRTFITLLSTMTEITNIQAVSGHKDIKVLTDYIKRSDKELNSIRSCFNDVFSREVQEKKPDNQSPPPVRVKATIIQTRKITH